MTESDHIEGTLVLEGLIEGPLPSLEGDPVNALEDWCKVAQEHGLTFYLEQDAGTFNLMPDTQAVEVERIGQPPDEVLRQLVEQLVALFPETERTRLFSTLRSVEYRPGEAVQTLYTVDSQARVDTQQRSVEEQTTPPVQPLSLRQKIRLTAFGVAAAAILLGVTSLFVDLPKLGRQLVGTIRPLEAEHVEVDVDRFAPYLTMTNRQVQNNRFMATLKPTQQLPTSWKALNRAGTAAPMKRRLALEAIARGYVRCELFSQNGQFLKTREHRIVPLLTDGSVKLKIPLPHRQRLGRVRLTF